MGSSVLSPTLALLRGSRKSMSFKAGTQQPLPPHPASGHSQVLLKGTGSSGGRCTEAGRMLDVGGQPRASSLGWWGAGRQLPSPPSSLSSPGDGGLLPCQSCQHFLAQPPGLPAASSGHRGSRGGVGPAGPSPLLCVRGQAPGHSQVTGAQPGLPGRRAGCGWPVPLAGVPVQEGLSP